ncbi:hypothetical protein D0A40_14330 [Xanthomonas campestris pv. raphani]|nr:hypothetical protein D0A40_14330 [Xanthomonas campestris pv. raphani]
MLASVRAARPGISSSARQTSCLTRRRGTSLCRSPPIPGHAAASARRCPELADLERRRQGRKCSVFGRQANRYLPPPQAARQRGNHQRLVRAGLAEIAALRSANTGTFEEWSAGAGAGPYTTRMSCKSPHGWVHGVSCPGARGPLHPKNRGAS